MVFHGMKKFQPTRLLNRSKSKVIKEPAAKVTETENVFSSVVETTFIEDVGQEFALGHSSLYLFGGGDEGRNEAEGDREVLGNEREVTLIDEAREDDATTTKPEQVLLHTHLSEHENDHSTYQALAIKTNGNEYVKKVLAVEGSSEEVCSSNKGGGLDVQFGRTKIFQRRVLFKSKSKHKHSSIRTLVPDAVVPTFPEVAIEDGGVEDEVEVLAVNKLFVLDDLEKRSTTNGKDVILSHGVKEPQPKGYPIEIKPRSAISQPKPEPEPEENETKKVIGSVTFDGNSTDENQFENSAGETRPSGEELSPSRAQQFAIEPKEVFEVVLKGTLVDGHHFIDKKKDETSVKVTNEKIDKVYISKVPSRCLKTEGFGVELEGSILKKHSSFEQEDDPTFIERSSSKRRSKVGSERNQGLDLATCTEHESQARNQRGHVDRSGDTNNASRKEKQQESGTKPVSRNDEPTKNVLVDSILFNLAKAEVAAKADGDVDAQVKIHLLRAKILRITKTRDEWATKVDGIRDDDEPDEVFVSGPFKRLLSPVLENLERAVNIIDRAILNGTTGVIMNTANLIDHQCIGNEREITISECSSVNSMLDSEIESIFTA